MAGAAIEVDTSRPGTRVQAVLNRLADARRIIQTWRIEYKTERPHGSLGNLTTARSDAGRFLCSANSAFLLKRCI
jgi:transposase InsO family protein